MYLNVEQPERSTFSDGEPVALRKRKILRKNQFRSSASISSSFEANEEQAQQGQQNEPSLMVPRQQIRKNSDTSRNRKSSDMSKDFNEGFDGTCPLESEHQGKKLLNVVVGLPVDIIFSLIFVQDQVMAYVFQARKSTEVVNGPWQEDPEGGQLCRQVTYSMAINVANFGSKTSYVTEQQTIQRSQKGQCHVIVTEATNSGIPYGDSFTILNHYCILREDTGKTKITVWTQVKYKKQVWGVMKGMLERNCYNGVETFLAELLSQITLVAERSERKENRPPTPRMKTHTRNLSHGYKRQKAGKEIVKETPAHSNKWIAVSMILAFVLLILSNYILYNKLLNLEQRSERRLSNLPPNRYVDIGNVGDMKPETMQQYQDIQTGQRQTWLKTVSEAADQLQQIQEALEVMLGNIRNNEDAVMSVLQNYKYYKNVSKEDDNETEVLTEDETEQTFAPDSAAK